MKTKVKQITFSEPMVKQIERTVKQNGITFPEFIRHLVLSYYENQPIHPMTSRTERKAIAAMKSTNNTVKTDDISKLLQSL